MATDDVSGDVRRYTMQSFVGAHLSTMQASERQKDAIQRLIHLSEDKFDALCDDIINEIHRRNGMQYKVAGPIYDKLTQLGDQKFKSLVVDVLLVYNYRYPGPDTLKLDDLMSNLQTLINDLRERAEHESLSERLKDLTFINQIEEYNRFIKERKRAPEEVTSLIDKSIKKTIAEGTDNFINVLAYPEELLRILGKSDVGQLPEFRKRSDRIIGLIKKKKEDGNSEDATAGEDNDANERVHLSDLHKEKEVKHELVEVLRIVIENSMIPARQVETLKDEIEVVLNALDEIQTDLKGGSCVNLEKMSSDIRPVLNVIVARLKNRGRNAKQIVKRIAMHRVAIEDLNHSGSKIEAFGSVLDLARDIREALER